MHLPISDRQEASPRDFLQEESERSVQVGIFQGIWDYRHTDITDKRQLSMAYSIRETVVGRVTLLVL
jgi:hypothetical protein